METSKYRILGIPKYHADHVGEGNHYNKMTMSADSRGTWQVAWRSDSLNEPPLSPCSLQQSSLLSIRTRSDVPLRCRWRTSFGTLGFLLVLIASMWIVPTSAVMIDFQNCLSESYQSDTPLQLQFDPLFVNAVFNTTDSSHNLNITVYGNVTGSSPLVVLPNSTDTDYWNSNQTNLGGKIENIPYPPPGANFYTTLFNKVNVLTYEPWSDTVKFCDQLLNAACPLAPSFNANA
jgi:hypothetical protein